MKHLLIILFIAFMLCECGDDLALDDLVIVKPVQQVPDDSKRFEDLAYIKQDLSNHIGIYNGPLDLVTKIINAVHENTVVRASPPEYDWFDFRGRYDGAFYHKEPHLCGGLAYLAMLCLRAYDIPSRYVGLYTSTEAGYWSHATLEVYLPEYGWIIAEPTFGSLVINNSTDEYMSWHDVRNGEPVRLSDESHRAGWDIWAGAGITNYMIIFPAIVENTIYPLQLIPGWWDGRVIGIYLPPTGPTMYTIIGY